MLHDIHTFNQSAALARARADGRPFIAWEGDSLIPHAELPQIAEPIQDWVALYPVTAGTPLRPSCCYGWGAGGALWRWAQLRAPRH